MDDKNKGVNERWARPDTTPERGYVRDEPQPDRSTTEIRSEIEQTRAEMGETIDEIQERLRPSNVVSRATESVRDSAVGKMREVAHSAQEAFSGSRTYGDRYDYDDGSYGIMDRIREHPVPTALAAVSLAWLAFSGRGHRQPSDRAIYGSTAYGEPYLQETRIGVGRGYRSSARRGMSSAEYDSTPGSERAMHDTAERMKRTAGDVRHAAGETAEHMGDAARHAGYEVRRRTRRASSRLEHMLHENPLAVGAMALAAGATVGLLIPETRREHELMGDTRDQLFDKARDAAVEAKERVEQAATRAASSAQDAAQKAVTDTLTGSDDTRSS